MNSGRPGPYVRRTLGVAGVTILLAGLLLLVLGGAVLSLQARLLLAATSAAVAIILYKEASAGREVCDRGPLHVLTADRGSQDARLDSAAQRDACSVNAYGFFVAGFTIDD